MTSPIPFQSSGDASFLTEQSQQLLSTSVSQLETQLLAMVNHTHELTKRVVQQQRDINDLKRLNVALGTYVRIQPSAEELYSLAMISSDSGKPGSGPSGSTEGSVTVQSPCKFKKVLAVVLTIIALIAIAVLIACIIAACGGFPLLLSALNLYTIGACVSLPIIASTSVALICLCTFVANSLIKPVITVRTTR